MESRRERPRALNADLLVCQINLLGAGLELRDRVAQGLVGIYFIFALVVVLAVVVRLIRFPALVFVREAVLVRLVRLVVVHCNILLGLVPRTVGHLGLFSTALSTGPARRR